jgi:FkbM family methyltransferase
MSATNRIIMEDDINNISLCGEKPIRTTDVETITLNDVIEESPFKNWLIDYLNIDCEGHDYQVLCGLDIKKYSPRVISIEAWTRNDKKKIIEYLELHGYEIDAVMRHTIIFVKNI